MREREGERIFVSVALSCVSLHQPYVRENEARGKLFNTLFCRHVESSTHPRAKEKSEVISSVD